MPRGRGHTVGQYVRLVSNPSGSVLSIEVSSRTKLLDVLHAGRNVGSDTSSKFAFGVSNTELLSGLTRKDFTSRVFSKVCYRSIDVALTRSFEGINHGNELLRGNPKKATRHSSHSLSRSLMTIHKSLTEVGIQSSSLNTNGLISHSYNVDNLRALNIELVDSTKTKVGVKDNTSSTSYRVGREGIKLL